MFGLPEVIMIGVVVAQGILFAGIAYFGVRMMRRQGFGRRESVPVPYKPIGL
jgi:hypothetical protein